MELVIEILKVVLVIGCAVVVALVVVDMCKYKDEE